MKHAFQYGEEAVTLDITPDGDNLRIRLPDGAERVIRARRLPHDMLEVTEGDRTFRVPLARSGRDAVSLWWQGSAHTFTRAVEGRTGTGPGGGRQKSGVLTAPMVGVVAGVGVQVGERVEAYQAVATVEAMKVLATLEAPFAGTVTAVRVAKGDRVEHGAVLVEITPEEAEEAKP